MRQLFNCCAKTLLRRVRYVQMLLCALSVMCLMGCERGESSQQAPSSVNGQTQDVQNSTVHSDVNRVRQCPVLVDILSQCSKSGFNAQSIAHMQKLIQEQIQTLPADKANKRCQELEDYWQVVCGVVPSQSILR